MNNRRKRRLMTPAQQDSLLGRLRIGDLNKLFGHRYGGGRDLYEFPDDDAGRIDLEILAQHYARSNPLKLVKVITTRAPWCMADELQCFLDRVAAYPRQWKAETLGHELGVTASEWRALKICTIAPADLTKGQRDQIRKFKARVRKTAARRQQGAMPRTEYLAANDISRTKPWLAEGISRKTWYKRRAKGGDKSGLHKSSLCTWDTRVTTSQAQRPKGRESSGLSVAPSPVSRLAA
jgi:hypothetical protein